MELHRPVDDTERGLPRPRVAAFLAALVEVSTPIGRLIVQPVATATAANTVFPPGTGHVAVLTAYNPLGVQTADHVNLAAQQALERRLEAAGFATWPALGRNASGTWSEQSVAIPDLPLDQAVPIAQTCRQAALFLWAPGRLSVVWTPDGQPATADTRHARVGLLDG